MTQRKVIIPYEVWAKIIYAELALTSLATQKDIHPLAGMAAKQLTSAVAEITFDRLPANHPANLLPSPTWPETPGPEAA